MLRQNKKIVDRKVRNVLIVENNVGGLEEVDVSKYGIYGNTIRNDFVKRLMNTSLKKPKDKKAKNRGEAKGLQEAATNGADNDIIQPPYEPSQLALLLTLNAAHFRCCETKATDITAKGYELKPSDGFITGVKNFTKPEQAEIDEQTLLIKKFLTKVDGRKGMDALSKKLGLDFESIGWMAVEVIRNTSGEILDIKHIKAQTIKVCYNKEYKKSYYIQEVGNQKVRFVNFGEKFKFSYDNEESLTNEDFFKEVKRVRSRTVKDIVLVPSDASEEYYEESAGIDGKDAKESLTFMSSANEVLMIVQDHPSTTYYGLPSIIPALASLNGNISIEDYMNQYFENNAIPRYLIILEGTTDIDDNVASVVTKFFRENIRGSAHSTLIFPVPEGVTVTVKPLEVGEQEASFQGTRDKNRDEIIVAHGMTPAQIGVIDAANLGSGSGLSQAENYKDRILTPRQNLFANLFWNRLFGREGLGLVAVKIKFKAMDIKDENLLRLKHEVALRYGVLSINEVRYEMGYEAITGGDRAFLLVGNQIMFIDEMTNKKSGEVQDLENEVRASLRDSFKPVEDDEEEEEPKEEPDKDKEEDEPAE